MTTIPCLSVVELSRRWRCRPAKVREMIRSGMLSAISINDRVRITPEAIQNAEQALALRPKRLRRKEAIPPEVRKLLDC